MVKELNGDDFEACLGERFLLDLGEIGTVALTLVRMDDRRESGAEGGGRPFSLTFRGGFLGEKRDRYLPQRTYTMRHERLGQLDIFIVPIGPDKEGMQYEAVFN